MRLHAGWLRNGVWLLRNWSGWIFQAAELGGDHRTGLYRLPATQGTRSKPKSIERGIYGHG